MGWFTSALGLQMYAVNASTDTRRWRYKAEQLRSVLASRGERCSLSRLVEREGVRRQPEVKDVRDRQGQIPNYPARSASAPIPTSNLFDEHSQVQNSEARRTTVVCESCTVCSFKFLQCSESECLAIALAC